MYIAYLRVYANFSLRNIPLQLVPTDNITALLPALASPWSVFCPFVMFVYWLPDTDERHYYCY